MTRLFRTHRRWMLTLSVAQLGIQLSLNASVLASMATDQDEIAHHAVAVVLLEPHLGLCSGTVIDPRHVLTAAHCVGKKMVILFGTTVKRGVSPEIGVLYSTLPDEYIPNPNARNRYDIAVLRLERAVPQGYSALKMAEERDLFASGDPVLMAGYGIPEGENNKDRPISLNLASFPILNPSHSKLEATTESTETTGTDPGDSGGSVVGRCDREPCLVGVINGGGGGGRSRVSPYSFFTKVGPLRRWIDSIVSEP